MKKMVFIMPGNEAIGQRLISDLAAENGHYMLHQFPDGETYVRILSEVQGREIIVVCTLHQADIKILPLYYLCSLLRDLKAISVCLVAPYLAYMRQDKVFHSGEAVTSSYFARLISGFADSLVTVDPHLHRWLSLDMIYSIPSQVIHADAPIAKYILEHVSNPLLIGPDEESRQWVSEVADRIGAPYIILEKTRLGDETVSQAFPELQPYRNLTPVLVDDIISTAGSMIETVNHLIRAGMKAPVCIGVHAVFSGEAFSKLQMAGAASIITCNTINHHSNGIDIAGLIAEKLQGSSDT